MLAALALAGCGLIAASAPSAVQLLVTREFGSVALHRRGALRASAGETVLDLLSSELSVITGSGGKLVRGIDGLLSGAQARAPGQTDEWSYYVNGVQASKGPVATSVHPGDHVWWDLHDQSQAKDIPAVVGAFPEPFLNGIEGKRLPVRVECASVAGSACLTVAARLHALHIPAAVAAITSSGAPGSLRVLVAPWTSIANDLGAQSLERGPRASGVYARFSANGQTLTLLDENGQSVETLRTGAGLIAATRQGEDPPVWLVTGTDEQGVRLAASTFDQSTLQDRFAVALGPDGATPLPDWAASG